MTSETLEQQNIDSDRIFTAITTADFDTYEQATQAVMAFWVPDMDVSRAGISHALGRLKKHYEPLQEGIKDGQCGWCGGKGCRACDARKLPAEPLQGEQRE